MNYPMRFHLFRKEIGKTESRSPIKVVLKILIIGITIACLVTAAIVAIQLSASAKKQADGKMIIKEQRCGNSLF